MLKLALAALLLGMAAALPAPPLCRVVASATPDLIPGLYTVRATIGTALDGRPCPVDGYAYVRLASGREYPLTYVDANVPFERPGVPWYWRLEWRSASGRLYRIAVPDLKSPFTGQELR
jgi:hypothetical protein